MKTLIAFAGKTGTTEKCARLLAGRLPGAVLADLTRETPKTDAFDTVVVGGSIRAGRLHGKARRFLEQNAGDLRGKGRRFSFAAPLWRGFPYFFKAISPKNCWSMPFAMKDSAAK